MDKRRKHVKWWYRAIFGETKNDTLGDFSKDYFAQQKAAIWLLWSVPYILRAHYHIQDKDFGVALPDYKAIPGKAWLVNDDLLRIPIQSFRTNPKESYFSKNFVKRLCISMIILFLESSISREWSSVNQARSIDRRWKISTVL